MSWSGIHYRHLLSPLVQKFDTLVIFLVNFLSSLSFCNSRVLTWSNIFVLVLIGFFMCVNICQSVQSSTSSAPLHHCISPWRPPSLPAATVCLQIWTCFSHAVSPNSGRRLSQQAPSLLMALSSLSTPPPGFTSCFRSFLCWGNRSSLLSVFIALLFSSVWMVTLR